jgi:hypothetical protein
MKKIILFAFILIVCGCQKPIPKKYVMRISQLTHNIYGKGSISNERIDTINAFDDTTAYSQAVKGWYALLITEKVTRNKVSLSNSFTIENASGVDLRITVPKTTRDSIDNLYKNVSKQDLK